jgi:hypothetical protein
MEFLFGLLFFLIVGLIPLALTVGGIALIVGAISKLLGK